MRHLRRVAVAVVIGAGVLPAQAAADGCVGLQCVSAGSEGSVPEAAQAHPRAAGPRELWTKRAGFYEYDDPAGGGSIVAYVVRPGEAEVIPQSVSALKVVADLRASGQFGSTVALILGPEMASMGPDSPGLVAARHARPRAVAADYNQCSAGYFCLWATAGYYGWVTWFGQTDWVNLSSTGMGANNVEARRNWRSTDSLLAADSRC